MDSRTETTTPGEMRERLIAKADADEAFRARLLSDPRAAVNEELGLAIPPGFTIKVHEGGRGHQPSGASAVRGTRRSRPAAGGRRARLRNDEAITFWDDF